MCCVDLIVVVVVIVIVLVLVVPVLVVPVLVLVVVQCRGQDPLGGTRLGSVRRKTYVYRPVT